MAMLKYGHMDKHSPICHVYLRLGDLCARLACYIRFHVASCMFHSVENSYAALQMDQRKRFTRYLGDVWSSMYPEIG